MKSGFYLRGAEWDSSSPFTAQAPPSAAGRRIEGLSVSYRIADQPSARPTHHLAPDQPALPIPAPNASRGVVYIALRRREPKPALSPLALSPTQGQAPSSSSLSNLKSDKPLSEFLLFPGCLLSEGFFLSGIPPRLPDTSSFVHKTVRCIGALTRSPDPTPVSCDTV